MNDGRKRRQITTVERLRAGDRVRLESKYVPVDRVTGTPGRNPSSGARKKRVYVKDQPGFLLVPSDTVVEIRPRVGS